MFDEEQCIKFLLKNKIINEQKNCQYCNSELYYRKKLYTCKNANCNKSISVLNNSLFSNSHLQCCNIMFIGYLWLSKVKYTSISYITK